MPQLGLCISKSTSQEWCRAIRRVETGKAATARLTDWDMAWDGPCNGSGLALMDRKGEHLCLEWRVKTYKGLWTLFIGGLTLHYIS